MLTETVLLEVASSFIATGITNYFFSLTLVRCIAITQDVIKVSNNSAATNMSRNDTTRGEKLMKLFGASLHLK
jgi:hypothetical protein